MELVLLRRIYRVPELFQLLATFGVVLAVQDLVLKVWGPLDILGPRAPGLGSAVDILGHRFPAYELFLIAMGPLVLGLLWLLMHKTRFGVLVRAATQDREMVGALGVNQALLFTGTLFLGAALAGLGGALQTPKLAANPHMDISVIAEAFVVTVVGGMGSVPGAFLAALLIGQLQAFGILVFPKITLVLVFLLMALVLVVRPWGLMGRPDAGQTRVVLPEGIVRLARFGRPEHIVVAVAAVVLLALPLVGDAYLVKVAIEVLCFALAAFSLNFLIGVGGIVSFGHAAYFGLGAYAAGLLVTKLGFSMEPALLAAPVIAGLGAALFGFFVVRLTGIYLAMLTLAFAQIVYAVAFQWVEVTGGDNGVVGVWPSRWAAGRVAYYYLTLAVSAAAIVLLRQGIYAPFGYTLRAARDFGRARRRHRHRRAHAPLARLHHCRRRGGPGRRPVRLLQGLHRPDADLHPDVGRFPGDDAARRRADRGRAAGRRGGVPFHPRFPHAAHRLLAPAAGPRHHRHRAGLPARHRRRRHGPAIAVRPARHRRARGPRHEPAQRRGAEQIVRRRGGRAQRHVRRRGRQAAGRHRPQRRRQVDDLQHGGRPARARQRPRAAGRRDHHRPGAAPHLAPGRRAHVPGGADLRVHDGGRERADGADQPARPHARVVARCGRPLPRRGDGPARARRAWAPTPTGPAASWPTATSSAWSSPSRWPARPSCC